MQKLQIDFQNRLFFTFYPTKLLLGWMAEDHESGRCKEDKYSVVKNRLLSQKRIMTKGELIQCPYLGAVWALFCLSESLIVGDREANGNGKG